MSNIWVLFKNNLYVSIVKKKTSFLLGLFAPVVILLVMGKVLSFGGGKFTVAIVDNDRSNTSKALIEFIEDTGLYDTIQITDAEAEDYFSNKSIYGLISFPEGLQDGILYGEEPKVTVKAREDDGIHEMLRNILYPEIVNYRKIAAVSQRDEKKYLETINSYKNNSEIKIEKKSLSDLNNDFLIANVYVGFIIFFMLLRGSNGAIHYFEEKHENVFNRFFMAPIKTYQYYLADLLSNYVVVLIQAIMGVLGIIIIGANTGVAPLHLFVIMAVVGLVSVSLALAVRAFSKTYNEFNMAYNFLTMALTMLGGGFVPLEIMPKLVNNISYITPTRWAMEAVADLQVGLGFEEVVPYIVIMILFATVFFVVAAYKTAKADKEFTV